MVFHNILSYDQPSLPLAEQKKHNACITWISKDVFTLLHLSQIPVLSISMSKIDFPPGKSYMYIDNTTNMSVNIITIIVTFKPLRSTFTSLLVPSSASPPESPVSSRTLH